MFSKCKQIILGCIVSLTVVFSVSAQTGTQAFKNEIEAATQALQRAAQAGPRQIPLADQAVLNLPADYYFIPKAESDRYLRALGNQIDNTFLGMVIGEQLDGFVVIEYLKVGYIKDDDARNWDTDELLENLKQGTEYTNQERVKLGLSSIEVTGWIEKPFYDVATHRLIWSLGSRDKGAASAEDQELGVNYNTYLLGREGYLSMNLVTNRASIEAEKPFAKQLLAATEFKQGKRYQDFNAQTDHIAEYGLAALVGGVAAKKLGLLALAAAFFVKFWKLLLVGLFAVGAIIRSVLKKKKSVDLSK